jgi:hypothetical protein
MLEEMIVVEILEDRGIYSKGDKIEMARAKGLQWVSSGFAGVYVKPKAAPEEAPQYSEMSKEELKAELSALGLAVGGNKDALLERLLEALAND